MIYGNEITKNSFKSEIAYTWTEILTTATGMNLHQYIQSFLEDKKSKVKFERRKPTYFLRYFEINISDILFQFS